MSAPTNAAAKADTKRGRASEAESTGPDSTDRTVRQRIEPSAVLSAPAPPASAASAAVSSAAVISARLSLMRLAVVERQLIMQALDIISLARLASTCSQLRAEALHREAGKFIADLDPQFSSSPSLRGACYIHTFHSAHASPLFHMHVPMRLSFDASDHARSEGEWPMDSLLDKAALFSRVSTLFAGKANLWTEPQMLRLLTLPCMQHVRSLRQIEPVWLENPRVQTALLSLPLLTDIWMTAGPSARLLPSVVASAFKWTTLYINVDRKLSASVRSLLALRLAPGLTDLTFYVSALRWTPPVLTELVWCLPPTLTFLGLQSLGMPHDLPRPLAKALFSRTPLLQTLELSGSIETSLRGLLDAGLHALPMLRQLRFREAAEADFSLDEDPDPIPALLRRFMHRFPQVTVQLFIHEENWQDHQLWTMQVRYLVWPRVELRWAQMEERIAAPPSPHASDDEEGSDVEDLVDPLAAKAH